MVNSIHNQVEIVKVNNNNRISEFYMTPCVTRQTKITGFTPRRRPVAMLETAMVQQQQENERTQALIDTQYECIGY